MPPAAKWFQVVLQSIRGRPSHLARRVAHLDAGSALGPEQPHRFHEGDGPLGPLLDALGALGNERREVFSRLRRLDEAVPVALRPPARKDNDPLGPLFGALESISSELTGFAARLAGLEASACQVQFLSRSPRLVNSSSADATVRAARDRLARKAV